jgi:hypothetical protein
MNMDFDFEEALEILKRCAEEEESQIAREYVEAYQKTLQGPYPPNLNEKHYSISFYVSDRYGIIKLAKDIAEILGLGKDAKSIHGIMKTIKEHRRFCFETQDKDAYERVYHLAQERNLQTYNVEKNFITDKNGWDQTSFYYNFGNMMPVG